MSRPDDTRASGETQVTEVTAEESARNDDTEQPVEDLVGHQDDKRSIFRTPGFSRMSLAWKPEDAQIVAQARASVDERMLIAFKDAYQIMHDLFMEIREPVVDDQGEIVRDRFGWPEWKRTPSGGWVEDWTALNRKQKENLLFQITTRLFAWEMAAADAWGEAMFAKAQWEERFAISYDAPVTGTIQDRTAKGRLGAAEERYFAIFLTLFSRKSDSMVRNMSLLGQRLKDTLDLG